VQDESIGADPAQEAALLPARPAPGSTGPSRDWEPIIVDQAVPAFEPNPPAVAEYRPDTVHDGWSTKSFTVRLASVRGYLHRYNGAPRQDDVAVGADPRTGIVAFAVADGVSSATQSHIGSSIACTTLVELQRQMLARGHEVNFRYAVQAAATRITEQAAYLLRQDNPEPKDVERLLATTLTAGFVRFDPKHGAIATLVQIGDSGAWVLRDGRYLSLFEPKNNPDAAVISSAVSPLPRVPDQLTPVQYLLAPQDVLLVGTDGFGDPLGDGDGLVGRLFAEHLATPPPARGLAHLLDFSRDTFDDDRTLLAIWQQAQPSPKQASARHAAPEARLRTHAPFMGSPAADNLVV
jgi:hypothetical protein